MILPEEASQAERAHLRAELALDAPLLIQYILFAKDVLHGQFGVSTRWRGPLPQSRRFGEICADRHDAGFNVG
jgi:peptide/nickel transport system permease protein